MARTKRVYVAYTGGTVGMRATRDGWAPAPGSLARQMKADPVFRAPGMPEAHVHEYEPLLDSAEMTPRDWVRIARDVERNHDAHDGFVVLHGTDTMAYTASALAFMLDGLRKPVIMTGSQIPLVRPRNDARANLVTALLLAAGLAIPEVCLYFAGKLLRGCRAVKVDCFAFEAFASPNLAPLATVGVDVAVNRALVRPVPRRGRLVVHDRLDPLVGVLWLFPGITGDIVRNFLRPPLKGAVLRAFGVGNGPVHDRSFMAAIEEATARGVVIVDCTQCLVGAVDLTDYATGTGLARAGVVSGGDMTTEAALTKLFYLFGRGLAPDEVRRQVTRDLRGELTVRPR